MLSAISSSGLSPYSAPKKSATDLNAQLQRYQKQLADCVTCPSAKTPAGKKNIQEISAKINGLQQQMQQASHAKSVTDDSNSSINAQSNQIQSSNTGLPLDEGTNIGSRLNVFT